MRVIIHAPSTHIGGGKSLLSAVLQALSEEQGEWSEAFAILDRRLAPELGEVTGGLTIAYADAGFTGRLRAEWMLARVARPHDVVLCFGNLPPLFKVSGFVVTYIQNTYITATDQHVCLSRWIQFQVGLQRLWFRWTQSHSQLFAVQTVSMRDRLIQKNELPRQQVILSPFIAEPSVRQTPVSSAQSVQWDFGYISLPWPHKNHRRLIEAFIMLAERGLTPSLVVTVPAEIDAPLVGFIEQAKRAHGVRVTNLGQLEYEGAAEIYRAVGALIFPSLAETIGLPLLEAQAAGLPILAAELDYVRDVVRPTETFDPASPRSIMRAILRFLGRPEEPQPMLTPHEMLADLVQRASSRSLPCTRVPIR